MKQPFDARATAPETALSALDAFDGPVLIDLDETLYLRNSTEDFLDTARPGLLALVLLKLLDLLGPWRWTGGPPARDAWRVGLIRLLFPWTIRAWRRRATDLARHVNAPLLAALMRKPEPAIVVTAGFRPIVEPLLAAMGLAGLDLVASEGWGVVDRQRGKLAVATDALGAATVRRSLVLTDSASDLPLLAASAHPLRTVWPDAEFRPAFAGIYLPGRYISKVKRPGKKYLRRSVLQDEFPLWILASAPLATSFAPFAAGMALLLLSFWAIYEQGYVDNDRIARDLEADPVLTPEFWSHHAPPRFAPWAWAAVSGTLALWLLRWPAAPSPVEFAAWAAVLGATALWFRLYNRFDKATRAWLYAGLPLARVAGFAAVVPIVAVSQFAIGAHVLAKWFEYFAYRRETRWPDLPVHLLRLACFIILCAVAALSSGMVVISLLEAGVAGAFLAFFIFKARHDIGAVIARGHRLDRSAPTATSAAPSASPAPHVTLAQG